MASLTKRDQVWIKAIESFTDDLSETPSSIADDVDVSERTARDTLKAMSSSGLAREDRLPDGRVRYLPAGPLSPD